MSSIPRVFRLVAVLAIMTAGLAIPSAAHAVGGSPQFPFCASSPVITYGEFVYRDQWTWGPVRYVGSRALWASNTGLRGLGAALMQDDGNLVVYNGTWRPLWASNTCCRSGNFLKVQTDGNLVIYTRSLRPIWESGTGGTP